MDAIGAHCKVAGLKVINRRERRGNGLDRRRIVSVPQALGGGVSPPQSNRETEKLWILHANSGRKQSVNPSSTHKTRAVDTTEIFSALYIINPIISFERRYIEILYNVCLRGISGGPEKKNYTCSGR